MTLAEFSEQNTCDKSQPIVKKKWLKIIKIKTKDKIIASSQRRNLFLFFYF